MGPLIGRHMSVSPLMGCHMSGCHLMMLTPAPGGQWRWTVSWLHPNIVCLVTSSALTVIIRVIISDITVLEEAILTMSCVSLCQLNMALQLRITVIHDQIWPIIITQLSPFSMSHCYHCYHVSVCVPSVCPGHVSPP